MQTTFKYNNQIITTPNLEKKLKRMKISLEDIEILPTVEKAKTEDDSLEFPNHEHVKVKSTEDNIIRVVIVNKGTRPDLHSIFDKQIWNGLVGIKGLTKELIDTFYYDE